MIKVVILAVSSELSNPRVLFGDLHVHSDDTIGTEPSAYNFSYGHEKAGIDVLGYTANDFQITKERWDSTLKLIQSLNKPGEGNSSSFRAQSGVGIQLPEVITTLYFWKVRRLICLSFRSIVMETLLDRLSCLKMVLKISSPVLDRLTKYMLPMHMQQTATFSSRTSVDAGVTLPGTIPNSND